MRQWTQGQALPRVIAGRDCCFCQQLGPTVPVNIGPTLGPLYETYRLLPLHCRTGAWSSVSMRAKDNLAVSFLVFMLQMEGG